MSPKRSTGCSGRHTQVQQAPAARASDLVQALRARPAPAPLHDARGGASRVACPTCRAAGRALHESFPRFTPVKDVGKAPRLLWIIVLRSTGDGLSRHRVALPSRLVFDDGPDGGPRALEPDEAPPRGVPSYRLACVMLYHSKSERGDPPPEFEGDSGGRYSICVDLGKDDGLYWLHGDDDAAPVRGERGAVLLETHCHSAFYNAELPCSRRSAGDVASAPPADDGG